MADRDIRYSRHAKRRMSLYKLTEEDVSSVLEHQNPDFLFPEGKNEVISEAIFTRHGYPIKVVFSFENGDIVVITAYPLKKGVK